MSYTLHITVTTQSPPKTQFCIKSFTQNTPGMSNTRVTCLFTAH